MKKKYDLEKFLDSIYIQAHSHDSVKTYRNGIKKLERYLHDTQDTNLEGLVSSIKDGKQDVYEFLRDFVIHLDKSKMKASTVAIIVAAAKSYLRFCGIKIYNEDFRQMVKMPRRLRPVEMPLTKEIISNLLRQVSFKMQTCIIFCVASGVRIGELVQIRITDIDFDTTPTRVRIRAETTKTGDARETFLTHEATEYLKNYLKRYFEWNEDKPNPHMENVYLFGRTSISKVGIRKSDSQLKIDPITANKILLQKTLEDYLKKSPDLNMRVNGNRYAIHFHNFRKFFRTTVGNNIGRDFAEALIGHRFYMDTYYTIPDEKKRQMYLEAEPHLTISNFENVEKNLKMMADKHTTLENKVNDLIEYLKKNSIEIPENLV